MTTTNLQEKRTGETKQYTSQASSCYCVAQLCVGGMIAFYVGGLIIHRGREPSIIMMSTL